MGEAYTELIAGGGPEVLPPVEALLDVAAHPEGEVHSVSFNFWHRLARALTTGLQPEGMRESACCAGGRAGGRWVCVWGVEGGCGCWGGCRGGLWLLGRGRGHVWGQRSRSTFLF